MLHPEALPPGTLPVLERLMGMPILSRHVLVGGTALALRYGHRISVDLDLFSEDAFDPEKLAEALAIEFGNDFAWEPEHRVKFALFCYVGHVKVDIVHYQHKAIAEPVKEDGIRMFTDDDLAAMKVQAILGRGKKKDFWDLFELLKHHDMQWIIDRHKQKYPNQMFAISIPKALSYFTDAENSESPVSLKGQTWEGVKEAIQKAVSAFLL